MPIRSCIARMSAVAAAACLLAAGPARAQTPVPAAPGITRVVRQFEQALATGRAEAYTSALAATADRQAAEQFAASTFDATVTRAAVREQDRAVGLRAGREAAFVVLEMFSEFGPRGRVATCRLDLQRTADAADGSDRWEIVGQETLTTLTGLFRLAFDSSRAHPARGVVVRSEDLVLQWQDGMAFVIEAAGRPTGLILVGRGEMAFTPGPASERGQLRIFAGAEQLQVPVDAVYVRFNPGEFEERVKGLGPRQAADPRDSRRAEDLFREHGGRSYVLDLGTLSAETWSLLPKEGDLQAEIATRRFGTLTYTRSAGDAEDVTLSDRRAYRYIAQYSSRDKLASRGLFYDEDAFAEYRVTHYDVEAQFQPDRDWMDGRATLRMVVTAPSISHVVIRLADRLTVRSVQVAGMGRAMALRVRGQNSLVVTLPRTVVKGTALWLSVTYGGSILPEPPDRGGAVLEGEEQQDEVEIELESSYLFSQQVPWYPQPAISGYATAVLRVIVPERYTVLASGEATAPGDPQEIADLKRAGLRVFAFAANRPLRYLACLISPMVRVETREVSIGEAARPGATRAEGASTGTVSLTVSTNARERGRGRALADLSADVVRFYGGLLGDCPYPSLNVALIERPQPGGHSPAYLTAIHFVFPKTGVTWRGDPAYIEGFPEYFVAHEIAHQWWGQAVGWKNYHEQWLSEGFAQYFAALYAERRHGTPLFQDILRRWQQWATDNSDQGAVYLGYRVGHIKGDSRVFRAVVYNKGATVLHMLRRFVGDEAFFRGLRRFYQERRFRKAGTDDLQRALEAESHQPLQRFFERWIHGDTLPRLRMATRVEPASGGEDLVVRLEQSGEVFDVPLTVSVECAGCAPIEIAVRLAAASQEIRIPLKGQLRRVDLNRVHAVPLSGLVVAGTVRAVPPSPPGAPSPPRATR